MNITSLYDTEFNRNLFENNGERTLCFKGKISFIFVGKRYFYSFTFCLFFAL